MQSTKWRQVVWDPKGSPSFVVGGGGATDIKRYEWKDDSIVTTAVCSDLGPVKSFAWNGCNFVALSTQSNRIIVHPLAPLSSVTNSGSSTPAPLALNLRNPRPCTALAFSESPDRYLAVGLEKARNEGLLIYDIDATARSFASQGVLQGTTSTPYVSQPAAIRGASPASNDSRPAAQLCQSEGVAALTFMNVGGSSGTSPAPLVGLASRFVRLFDLRVAANREGGSRAQWSTQTRAVHSLAANPHNAHQFACAAEDGELQLWDVRGRMTEPIIKWSEFEAGSRVAPLSSSSKPSAVSELKWHPTKAGYLSVLEKDSRALRVWSIVDGTAKTVVEGGGGVVDSRRTVLLTDYQTRRFSQPISSFAHALSPAAAPASMHFLGVTATSSPALELLHLDKAKPAGFTEASVILLHNEGWETFPIDTGEVVNDDDEAAEDEEDDSGIRDPRTEVKARRSNSDANREKPSYISFKQALLSRGRAKEPAVALTRSLSRRTGSTTPTRANARPESANGKAPASVQVRAGRAGFEALRKDPAVVLRERVEQGYGPNASANVDIFEGPIKEFWSWIATSEPLAADASAEGYSFAFRGVLDLVMGFPSMLAAATSASSSGAATPSYAQQHSHHPFYADMISKTLRRGDETRARDRAYATAVAALADRRGLRRSNLNFPSSKTVSHRLVALQACGSDHGETFEATQRNFIARHDFVGAAQHAILAGRFETALQLLAKCQDEKYRMITPPLAAFLAQKKSGHTDSVFADYCRSLSSDADDPFVRAIFAYLATSGDWRDFLDEAGLPLRDRLSVALRFLPDAELVSFLQTCAQEALSSADLEGVILLGLRGDGIMLLAKHVNRWSDVQTAALAASFVYPCAIPDDWRLERWVSTYRSLLDQLRLYSARALLDHAIGQRSRKALANNRMPNKVSTVVEDKLRKAAPAQLFLRCNFCSTTLSPSVVNSAMERGSAAPGKASSCPRCGKALPACVVCLMRPALFGSGTTSSSTLAYCLTCRHGGHSTHLLEWFAHSDVCPAVGCDCRCSSS